MLFLLPLLLPPPLLLPLPLPLLLLLQLRRRDDSGAWRDDVFTSFVFASRRRAYDTMVQRWREVK